MKPASLLPFVVIAAAAAMYSVPLVLNDMCLGWDCPFYMYNLSGKTTLAQTTAQGIEPLFFTLVRPLAELVGIVTAIKVFNVASMVVYLTGCLLLCRAFRFGGAVTLLVLAAAAFLPGIGRMWLDQYRNFLAMALFPYVIYAFFRVRSWVPAAAIMVLMALAHRFFWLPFLLFAAFSAVRRGNLKRLAYCSTLLAGLVIGASMMGALDGEKTAAAVNNLFVYTFSFPDFDLLHLQVNNYMTFNAMLLPVVVIALVRLPKHDMAVFMAMSFVMLSYAAVMYGQAFAGRLELVASFPAVFLIGMMLDGYRRQKARQFYQVAAMSAGFIVVLMLGLSCVALMNARQINTDSERWVLENSRQLIGEQRDALLIVSARVNNVARLYTDYDVRYADWWDMTEGRAEKTPELSRMFMGLGDWRADAGNRTVYLMWNERMDPVNSTFMDRRVNANEIKVIYRTVDGVRFGRLTP